MASCTGRIEKSTSKGVLLGGNQAALPNTQSLGLCCASCGNVPYCVVAFNLRASIPARNLQNSFAMTDGTAAKMYLGQGTNTWNQPTALP